VGRIAPRGQEPAEPGPRAMRGGGGVCRHHNGGPEEGETSMPASMLEGRKSQVSSQPDCGCDSGQSHKSNCHRSKSLEGDKSKKLIEVMRSTIIQQDAVKTTKFQPNLWPRLPGVDRVARIWRGSAGRRC
jgi:hypothetical protein